MQKQRREKQERRIAQKRDCQIQVSVSADRREEMKDKSSQAKRGKMQGKRRAPALLEKHKEPDQQIDQTDQIDIEITGRPVLNRAKVVEVRPVDAAFRGYEGRSIR